MASHSVMFHYYYSSYCLLLLLVSFVCYLCIIKAYTRALMIISLPTQILNGLMCIVKLLMKVKLICTN